MDGDIIIKRIIVVAYCEHPSRLDVDTRGLQYKKAAFPRNSYGLGVIQPDETRNLVFTFDKIALTKGQVFRVYFYENGGSRNLTLTLNINDVNKAMRM